MIRWDLFKKLSKRLTEVEVGQNSFGQLLIQSKVGQKFWHKLHLAEKPSLTLSFKFELTLIQTKVSRLAWTQAAQSFLSPYDAPNLARYLWTAIEYIYQNLYIFKNQCTSKSKYIKYIWVKIDLAHYLLGTNRGKKRDPLPKPSVS